MQQLYFGAMCSEKLKAAPRVFERDVSAMFIAAVFTVAKTWKPPTGPADG